MAKHKHKGKKPKDKFKNGLRKLLIRFFESNPAQKFNHKQVCGALDIKETQLRKQLYDLLTELAKDGLLEAKGHQDFQWNDSTEFLTGYLDINMRGAGFVKVEGRDEDIYVAPEHVGNSLNGDLVKVKVQRKGKKKWEGRIAEVLERERTQFVGTIQLNDHFAFLIPDNLRTGTDIYIPKEKLKGAKNKDKALVRLTVWPDSAANPYGEVIEVLTHESPNDTEMINILTSQGIEFIFPQEVIQEAEKINLELDPEEIKQRKDLRDTLTFTIDPFDAKDFDDALSIRYIDEDRFEIGVHIADVSHYVQPGSALDKEALKRSNSVYLVDRVIPMLPEQLSNVACSLRPHEDKFAFSALFEMNDEGEVFKRWFGKTVIHSNHRFAYEEAQEILEGKSHEIDKEILLFDKIAKILRNNRIKKGALLIDSEEVKFKLDDEGYPAEVLLKKSKDANHLIEEYMLLANREVATYLGSTERKVKIPMLFRVHDEPDSAKVELLRTFVSKFGHQLDFTHPDQIAKSINQLLSAIRDEPEYGVVQNMAIRSMAKATYETDNIGHYGLAFRYYTHFTSPIRRYADLVVHRILFEEINRQKHKYGNDLADIAKRVSRNERKAADAERESTKYFQTLFMLDKIGQELDGAVSGIAEHGMYVRMFENYCEGMVPLQEIRGDRYRFDPDAFQIVGQKTGNTFNIGDRVKVRVYEVNPRKRQIDLEFVEKLDEK